MKRRNRKASIKARQSSIEGSPTRRPPSAASQHVANPTSESGLKAVAASTALHQLVALVDVKGAAKVLGVSVKTLRDHVLHRRIDYVKIGARVLFRPDTLWDFIERNTVHALTKPPQNTNR